MIARNALRLLPLALVAGCFTHTKAIMTDTAPVVQRTPTCATAVHLYLTADELSAPYDRLALLKTVGSHFASRERLLNSMVGKAAKLGANGLVYRNIDTDSGLFGDPDGEAMAVWIPSDTARIAGECAVASKQ
jgi:hypothetical protein